MTELHLFEYNLVYVHIASISGIILETLANLDDGFCRVITWQRCSFQKNFKF